VSTQPEKVNAFFQRFTRERLRNGESLVAVLEVCGFHHWLTRMLYDYRCTKVILIQPDERKRRKTDRHDAAALSKLPRVNRGRLVAWRDGPQDDLLLAITIAALWIERGRTRSWVL
jgi:hypothetical protein